MSLRPLCKLRSLTLQKAEAAETHAGHLVLGCAELISHVRQCAQGGWPKRRAGETWCSNCARKEATGTASLDPKQRTSELLPLGVWLGNTLPSLGNFFLKAGIISPNDYFGCQGAQSLSGSLATASQPTLWWSKWLCASFTCSWFSIYIFHLGADP